MISIIANFSQSEQSTFPSYYYQVQMPGTLNGLSLQIAEPCVYFQPQETAQVDLSQYCLWDLEQNDTQKANNFFGCTSTAAAGQNYAMGGKAFNNYGKPEEYTAYSTPDGSKNQACCSSTNKHDSSRSFSGTNGKSSGRRDMVNYDILDGHKYEIRDNPDKDKCVNKRIYICKYDNCDKVFTKTWNLVSHFRIHTNEKPYKCNECQKLFTQRSNLSRHMAIHCKSKSIDRKIYGCSECSRKYSSKYNLNVSVQILRINY